MRFWCLESKLSKATVFVAAWKATAPDFCTVGRPLSSCAAAVFAASVVAQVARWVLAGSGERQAGLGTGVAAWGVVRMSGFGGCNCLKK